MQSEQLVERVKNLARQVTDREGCLLYDIEFSGQAGHGRVLRVYIEKTSEPVSIEDCSNVSKGLNLLLDVEDIIPGGAYVLEVSSPGLERSLREKWHFEGALGKRVWIKSKNSMVEGPVSRKQVTGELTQVNDEGVQVRFDGGELQIPFSNIEKAKLIFEFSGGDKPGPKAPKNKKKR